MCVCVCVCVFVCVCVCVCLCERVFTLNFKKNNSFFHCLRSGCCSSGCCFKLLLLQCFLVY